jgi:hypothetical protein
MSTLGYVSAYLVGGGAAAIVGWLIARQLN